MFLASLVRDDAGPVDGLLSLLPVEILALIFNDSDLTQDGWVFLLLQRLALASTRLRRFKEVYHELLVRLDVKSLTQAHEVKIWAFSLKSLKHLVINEPTLRFTPPSVFETIITAISCHLRTLSWLWYSKSFDVDFIPPSVVGWPIMPKLETLEFWMIPSTPPFTIPENLFRGFPALKVVRVVTLYRRERLQELRFAFRCIQHQVEEIAIRCLEDNPRNYLGIKKFTKLSSNKSPSDVDEGTDFFILTSPKAIH